jgi:hypothetical protein
VASDWVCAEWLSRSVCLSGSGEATRHTVCALHRMESSTGPGTSQSTHTHTHTHTHRERERETGLAAFLAQKEAKPAFPYWSDVPIL